MSRRPAALLALTTFAAVTLASGCPPPNGYTVSTAFPVYSVTFEDRIVRFVRK